LSEFTRSFLLRIESSASENVRYKDIMDFISDDFESNPLQTPVFVTQATFTELFAERTPKLEKAMTDFLIRLRRRGPTTFLSQMSLKN